MTVAASPVGAEATSSAKGARKPKGAAAADAPPLGTVEDLYALLRWARLNVLLYGEKLARLEFWSLALNLAAAVTASAGLVAAWNAAGFTAVPKLMGIATAVLTAARPILGLDGRIKRASGQWSGYLGVFQSADGIVRAVRAERAMTARQRALLGGLHDRMDGLEKADDPFVSVERRRRLRETVEAEIPVDGWWTQDEPTASWTPEPA